MIATRRGFSISPFVILLGIALIALIGWKVYVNLDYIATVRPPFANKARGRVISVNVVTILVFIALAGGVGAACYFAFRKSEQAANAGMAVVLLLGVGTFSYQTYNYFVNGPNPKAATQAPPGATLADAMKEQQDRAQAAQEKLRADNAAMAERAREAARPRPVTPHTTPGSSPPPATIQPDPAANPATSTPRTPSARPAAASPPESDPAIKQALDALKTEIDGQITELLSQAKALEESVAKPPPRNMPVMDKRVADAKKLKSDSSALAKRLRNFDDEAEKKLTDAGIDRTASMGDRIRFTSEFHASRRAIACDAYGRFCDEVIEESELLKRGFSNWKYDASGNVSSKDFQLQSQARSLRNRIDSALKQADDTADRLRGE